MKLLRWTTLIRFLLLLPACAGHRDLHERRTRQFEPGEYADAPRTAAGSLFAAGRPGLFDDIRSRNVGDVLIVRIQESDSAFHDSSTELDRNAEVNAGISGMIGTMAPDLGLDEAIGAETSQSMRGSGRIERRGGLKAILPVRVRQVLPNGDFFVEGSKVVLVGNEERQLYISGIVRPADIQGDGTVLSSRLADAEIAYTGFGDASDQQEVGWFASLLSFIWPF